MHSGNAPLLAPARASPPSILPFAEYRASKYFTALDGLRAVAILLVLLHHLEPNSLAGWISILADNGSHGVSLFFIISGYLICTLLLREHRATGRIALGRFYGRRALRLLPLYYAALGLQTVVVYGLHAHSPANEEIFTQKLPSYLFYFSNWLPTATQGPFFQAWSLAVEEQFYLGFGLLLVVLPRLWLLSVVIMALLVKFAVYQLIGDVDVGSTLWRIVFSYQEAILWGVLLAFALDQREIYECLATGLRSSWIVGGIGLLITVWLTTHATKTASTWDAQLMYVLMIALVAALVMRRSVPGLCHKSLVHVGRISYGIYLLHMFVFSAIRKLPLGHDPVFCFVLGTSVVIGIASLVYRYFELPIIHYYKHRLQATTPNVSDAMGTAVPVLK